jgi:DNA replication protein DnaC
MDDLGAELTNQFTVSALYNVINTRINLGKSTIINTNLGQNGLLERYDERITSRLFGEFNPYLFRGADIRGQK